MIAWTVKGCTCKDTTWAWEYDVIGPWYKCNMTDIMAGIGLAQLRRYDGILKRRQEIIEKYDDAFKPLGVEVLSHYTDKHQSSGHSLHYKNTWNYYGAETGNYCQNGRDRDCL